MKVEILTLCDYAQTYGDRLTIVGAFSSLNAKEFPLSMHDVTLVAKIVLDEQDNRKHDVTIIIKKEGEAEPIIGPISTPLDLSDNKEDFVEANLILKIGRLTIPSQGKYSLIFSFDGNETATRLSAIIPK
ncbi:DUF6941 family protein [Prevotella melaninogenica]